MSANQPYNLRRTELIYNRYTEISAPGETLESVMNADKWINVRKQFRINDVIEVIAADGSFEADIRVIAINQMSGAIKFRVIRHVAGEPVKAGSAMTTDRYEIKHAGFGRWRVHERETGAVVADGLDKEGAEAAKAEAELSRKAA